MLPSLPGRYWLKQAIVVIFFIHWLIYVYEADIDGPDLMHFVIHSSFQELMNLGVMKRMNGGVVAAVHNSHCLNFWSSSLTFTFY